MVTDLNVKQCVFRIRVPVPECSAELIQHVVQLHLQVVQQVTSLGVHLQRGSKKGVY